MNRRSFLTTLAAAFALDPERALWVPGKKLISIPKPRLTGWPASSETLKPGDIFTVRRVHGGAWVRYDVLYDPTSKFVVTEVFVSS